MGQQEVFTFLKKKRNKWFTAKQIAKGLKASYGSVGTSLMKLRMSGQIRYKKNKIRAHIHGRIGKFVYRHK
jgi:predicted transcriptional regulator